MNETSFVYRICDKLLINKAIIKFNIGTNVNDFDSSTVTSFLVWTVIEAAIMFIMWVSIIIGMDKCGLSGPNQVYSGLVLIGASIGYLYLLEAIGRYVKFVHQRHNKTSAVDLLK